MVSLSPKAVILFNEAFFVELFIGSNGNIKLISLNV